MTRVNSMWFYYPEHESETEFVFDYSKVARRHIVTICSMLVLVLVKHSQLNSCYPTKPT